MGWIARRIEKASWISFAIWFAVWFAYNLWALNFCGPWPRALEAGGGSLAEERFGFPTDEPQRMIEALGSNVAPYLLWQALDIPYALLNLMITSIAIALGLKAARLAATPLRFLLLLPPLYVACECVENAAVALFAARVVPPADPLVFVQQAATSLKLLSGYSSMMLGLAGLAIAAVAALAALLRRKAR